MVVPLFKVCVSRDTQRFINRVTYAMLSSLLSGENAGGILRKKGTNRPTDTQSGYTVDHETFYQTK